MQTHLRKSYRRGHFGRSEPSDGLVTDDRVMRVPEYREDLFKLKWLNRCWFQNQI